MQGGSGKRRYIFHEGFKDDILFPKFTGHFKGYFVKAQNAEFLKEENLRQIGALLTEVVDKVKMNSISYEELKNIMKLLYSD